MEPKILRSNRVKEFVTPEGCHISEIWNSAEDENVSVARARVEPGVTTALHYLEGVVERYVITAGKGRVEVGELPATEVSVGDVVIIPAGIPQRMTRTFGAQGIKFGVDPFPLKRSTFPFIPDRFSRHHSVIA